MGMKMTKEVDVCEVPRVGKATLTLSVEIDGEDATDKTWTAVYAPAAKGADAESMYSGDNEALACKAFAGAKAVLCAWNKRNRKVKP